MISLKVFVVNVGIDFMELIGRNIEGFNSNVSDFIKYVFESGNGYSERIGRNR